MGKQGIENFVRVLLLLMEGGMFISREILKRETKKKEDNLNDLLRRHRVQLERRFTEQQVNEVLPSVGGARLDDWNIPLLTGVLMELFRTTLTLREKRELLMIRNVRDELLLHEADVCLDDETFEDLRDQLEESLSTLSEGLEPALVVNCQRIIKRHLDEPIHMPTSLDYITDMCEIDDQFENASETLRKETKSVVDDIIGIVKKAEDQGRKLKKAKVIEVVIQPQSKNKEVLECVETALDYVTKHFGCADNLESEYAKIKRALEDIFEEVKTICQVFTKYEKGKGAIFGIECTSYRILTDVIAYLEGLQCLERLEEVAALLRKHIGNGNRLSLSCFFNEENMKSVFDEIKTENIEYSRTIALTMQVNDLQGLLNIWTMFEDEGAQNQLNELAEALSEYVGSKISITASVDKQKYKTALQEAVRQTFREEELQNQNTGDEESNHGTQESKDSTEDAIQASDVEGAIAPRRRHVEIVAVRPGNRETFLFDKIISEDERDEISEMGIDARDDRPTLAALPSSKIDESGQEPVSESNTLKTENKLEEPNLESYKSYESDEKHENLRTDDADTDLESGKRSYKACDDVTQNVSSEELPEYACEPEDIFYRNTDK